MDQDISVTQVVMFFVAAVVIFVMKRNTKMLKKADAKAAGLAIYEASYSQKAGIICSYFENFDRTHTQFFGTILSKDIKPGMALQLQGQGVWRVSEIYLDRNSDASSEVAPAHTKDAALVLETSPHFDESALKQQLETNGHIFLELR